MKAPYVVAAAVLSVVGGLLVEVEVVVVVTAGLSRTRELSAAEGDDSLDLPALVLEAVLPTSRECFLLAGVGVLEVALGDVVSRIVAVVVVLVVVVLVVV